MSIIKSQIKSISHALVTWVLSVCGIYHPLHHGDFAEIYRFTPMRVSEISLVPTTASMDWPKLSQEVVMITMSFSDDVVWMVATPETKNFLKLAIWNRNTKECITRFFDFFFFDAYVGICLVLTWLWGFLVQQLCFE